MTTDEARRRRELGDAEIRQISDVLAGVRRPSRVVINHELLKEKLNDLLSVTGVADLEADAHGGQSFDVAIAEGAFKRADHRYLHEQYRELADLAGQVERKLTSPELQPQLAAQLRFERARQTRSRRPRDCSTSEISGVRILHRLRDDLRLLKLAAENLSVFEKSLTGTGRPRSDLLDTLMLGLGDVYVEARGFDGEVLKLPRSPRSIFIRFCCEVLSHFFPSKAVDAEALSSRWKRLTAHFPNATQK